MVRQYWRTLEWITLQLRFSWVRVTLSELVAVMDGILLLDISQVQDSEVGDGTTSVAVFAAELLKVSLDNIYGFFMRTQLFIATLLVHICLSIAWWPVPYLRLYGSQDYIPPLQYIGTKRSWNRNISGFPEVAPSWQLLIISTNLGTLLPRIRDLLRLSFNHSNYRIKAICDTYNRQLSVTYVKMCPCYLS